MIDSPAKPRYSPEENFVCLYTRAEGIKLWSYLQGNKRGSAPRVPQACSVPTEVGARRSPKRGPLWAVRGQLTSQHRVKNRGGQGFFFFWTGPQESQNTDNAVKAAWAEPTSPTSCPTTQMNVWKSTPRKPLSSILLWWNTPTFLHWRQTDFKIVTLRPLRESGQQEQHSKIDTAKLYVV